MCPPVYTTDRVTPMSTVGIREIRGSLAAWVRRAHAGERIVITVDGTPVAQLAPLTPDVADTTIADLIARGRVVAPRRRDGWSPADPVHTRQGSRLDRIMKEARG
jgi:prevent-host-death family protein